MLHLSSAAEQLLIQFANKVEVEQRLGGRLENVTGFASKAPEHAARLAGVLTTYADPRAHRIDPEIMACGIQLADWYLSEAVRLRDATSISRETSEAEILRRWLTSSWREPFVSVRAIVRRGPNNLRESMKVRKLIQILENHGFLIQAEDGVEVEGERVREAWRVVRG